jgi:hypothetical protein
MQLTGHGALVTGAEGTWAGRLPCGWPAKEPIWCSTGVVIAVTWKP